MNFLNSIKNKITFKNKFLIFFKSNLPETTGLKNLSLLKYIRKLEVIRQSIIKISSPIVM